MKLVADAAMNHRPKSAEPQFVPARADWDLKKRPSQKPFETFFQKRQFSQIPPSFFKPQSLWLEIGAGTGHFFESMAKLHPDKNLVAIERDRMRGKRLVRRTLESGLSNFCGIRGNAISAFFSQIPPQSLERIYNLYPCPWPKSSQRKHRWHFHPVMPKIVSALEDNGYLIIASDQKFYIEESHYVLPKEFGLKVVHCGDVSPHPVNGLGFFPEGRTKFEKTFLSQGLKCYEVIFQKGENLTL
jgi:tRNA G46 methylase TrmB